MQTLREQRHATKLKRLNILQQIERERNSKMNSPEIQDTGRWAAYG